MKKKVVVLSLGGSLIIPDGINLGFLNEFKRVIGKNTGRFKFVIVCGGGSIARKYIGALRLSGIGEKLQNFAGISATRTNARFMGYFFNINQEMGIPEKTSQIRKIAEKEDIVFCGALEYKPRQTSDSTAAELAREFGAVFVNLTAVDGLYDKNPSSKGANLIQEISWKDFYRISNKIKYRPGQHFVLDQKASKTILEGKIPTYILGKDMGNLDNFLNGKGFRGTRING
jgi:uridylate kinase